MINNYYPSIEATELNLKHAMLVRILKMIVLVASTLTILRIFNPNKFLMLVDISFVIVSLIGIYFLNKSVKYIYLITQILIFVFYILVTLMFISPQTQFIGSAWFIVLILFSFYQSGVKIGLVVFATSLMTIVLIEEFLINKYPFTHYFYALVPLFVASIVVYLYELKVTSHEKLLKYKNIAQKQLLEEKELLLHLAHYDNLTKLPNRMLFNDRLQQAIAKTNRSNKDFAVLFIDLDKFKEVNDTHGHTVGDSVLCAIASRLKNTLREEDTLSRFGGDEFLCIMEHLESCEAVSILAKKLINQTKQPIHVLDLNIQLTCSIGISIYKKDAQDATTLLHHADTAMYEAKGLGKDNYQFYTPC